MVCGGIEHSGSTNPVSTYQFMWGGESLRACVCSICQAHRLLIILLQVQRSSSAALQQMRQEADDARQQLSTLRELTDKQIAKANAAAQQEVQQYRQRWRDEFEKRRKLHNQVRLTRATVPSVYCCLFGAACGAPVGGVCSPYTMVLGLQYCQTTKSKSR